MISVWFVLPVFAVGYFLGWRRGEFVGAKYAAERITEQVNKAIRESKIKNLKGEEK